MKFELTKKLREVFNNSRIVLSIEGFIELHKLDKETKAKVEIINIEATRSLAHCTSKWFYVKKFKSLFIPDGIAIKIDGKEYLQANEQFVCHTSIGGKIFEKKLSVEEVLDKKREEILRNSKHYENKDI